jgi:teichuronic acid exporter
MSLRKQATSGFVWTFAQQFGNQLIGFVVSVILARILLPEEFGLIGMIAIFLAVGKTLLDAGLTQSLVRSKDLDQEDYSTVFFFNLGASTLLYFLIYFSAPLIADFYKQSILTSIIRVFCLTYIIYSFRAVQSARLSKEMNFKTQALISIPSTIAGGIVGVVMAYTGFGVWSLVWSSLTSSFLGTLQLWVYSKWSPSLVFNIVKFKNHFNFGYKLTLSGLLDTIFNNLYIIVIGKYFSPTQVGLYTRAETMKQLPVTNVSSALNKVTFPLFASIQDDDLRLKRVYKQLMQMVVFIIAPVIIFLGVLAEPIFRFLFTEKWLPAVPYFQILCITGILYPIHAYNLNVLKVKGRSDLFLKLEVLKKIIIALTIVIALQFGITALLYGQIFTSIVAFFINSYYTGKFINYTSWQQSRDIAPIITLAAFSGIVIYFLDFHLKLQTELDIIRILGGSIAGLLVYLPVAHLLGFNSLNDIKKLILKK